MSILLHQKGDAVKVGWTAESGLIQLQGVEHSEMGVEWGG